MEEKSESNEGTILIKKYPNRRLYNTGSSQYVNLEDVAKMIRREKNIKVVDSATGNDITKDVMLQIIAESPIGKELIPIDFLRGLITLGGETVRGMMKKFMEEQSELASRMQKIMWTGFESNPLTNLWVKLASDYYRQHPEEAARDSDAESAKDREISHLREQLAALQQTLKKFSTRKGRPKKPKKSAKTEES
jgi:polyhydroxyalkanoate synthesis repressor PhaR